MGWPVTTCWVAHAQLFNVMNIWIWYNYIFLPCSAVDSYAHGVFIHPTTVIKSLHTEKWEKATHINTIGGFNPGSGRLLLCFSQWSQVLNARVHFRWGLAEAHSAGISAGKTSCQYCLEAVICGRLLFCLHLSIHQNDSLCPESCTLPQKLWLATPCIRIIDMCAAPGKCDLSVSYPTVSTVFHYLIEYFCFSTGCYDEVMPKTCLLRYNGCSSIKFYIFFLRLQSISVTMHSWSNP